MDQRGVWATIFIVVLVSGCLNQIWGDAEDEESPEDEEDEFIKEYLENERAKDEVQKTKDKKVVVHTILETSTTIPTTTTTILPCIGECCDKGLVEKKSCPGHGMHQWNLPRCRMPQ